MEQSGASAMDLFNGVSTHFLSECPGQGSQESVEDGRWRLLYSPGSTNMAKTCKNII